MTLAMLLIRSQRLSRFSLARKAAPALSLITRPLILQNHLKFSQNRLLHHFNTTSIQSTPSLIYNTSKSYRFARSSLRNSFWPSHANSSLHTKAAGPANQSNLFNNLPSGPTSIPTTPKLKSDETPRKVTRKDFVKSATGPLSALALNIKWVLLRQNRPFNIDEISAFASWILMGNFLWVFIGTTTFVGLLIYLGETVYGINDSKLNKRILKKLLTIDNSLNLDIDGEDFKMSWEDGKIKFNNVIVKSNKPVSSDAAEYKFNIDTINFTLSLEKFTEGRGLIKDVEIIGLIGDIDFKRNSEFFIDDSLSESYEFEKFIISDLKVDFKSENFKEPIELKLFSCYVNKLRRNWVVYDFLNADTLSGSFNGSLFTLHKRQNNYAHFSSTMDGTSSFNEETKDPWKKVTRLRIDPLDMSFLSNENSKLNWVQSGKVDLIIDIMLPNDKKPCQENSIQQIISNADQTSIYEQVKILFDKAIDYAKHSTDSQQQAIIENEVVEENKYVVMDVKLNFSEMKAVTPTSLPHSSLTHAPYISENDLRSLVTFINDKKFGLASLTKHSSSTLTSSDDENPFDGSDISETPIPNNGSSDNNAIDDDVDAIPPIKFRLVHNLKDFEYLDLPLLVTMMNVPAPVPFTANQLQQLQQQLDIDTRQMKSFINTNKFIDSIISETLSFMLLYKDELQSRFIDSYAKRTNFEIFFNNLILGNLILVGLGSFVV